MSREAGSEESYELGAIARLLSHTIGEEKAEQAVRDAARDAGLPPSRALTHAQTIDLLERIALTPGIVGVTARFAKSRLHLKR